MWFITPLVNLAGKAFDWLNKKQDTALEKYKVDGEVDKAKVEALAAVATARATDNTDRWGRRLFIYPSGILFALTCYMSIIKDHPMLSDYYWPIHMPGELSYVIYASVGYCLVAVIKR